MKGILSDLGSLVAPTRLYREPWSQRHAHLEAHRSTQALAVTLVNGF